MLGVNALGPHSPVDTSQIILEPEEWRFRPPPWGHLREAYELCPRVRAGVPCRLGEQCSHAHSQEELNEWQLKSSLRQKAIQAQSNERSFLNELLLQIAQVENLEEVVKEELDYAKARTTPEGQNVFVTRGSLNHWTVAVSSELAVQWIALVDESSHSEFTMVAISSWSMTGRKDYSLPAQCREWRNPLVSRQPQLGETSYAIKISFTSCVFGTFTQSIVFDFGHRPLLVQHFKVEVVPDPSAVDRVEHEEALICKDVRWDVRNSISMPFKPKMHALTAEDELLVARFPPPTMPVLAKADVLSRPLCPDTYRQRLHLLLNAEEWVQRELLSRYNFETELQLVESYWLTGLVTTAKFCVPGELFAQLFLHRRLTEDTAAGRIILTGCNTVLLSPCKNPTFYRGKRKVYEAIIEGKCKEIVYLRLSTSCVSELGLKPSSVLKVEIQFQLDRLQLCELHHAVDALPSVALVFPRMDNVPNRNWILQKSLEDALDSRLNAKQKEAIMWMMAPQSISLPPILLMGPYGTGKTFTLSQGIRNLLQHTNARILVCTHSNSAADLYVKDYLHAYVEAGMQEAAPLRVYYRHRRVETVHPIVLKYCLLESEGSTKVFMKPTVQHVMDRRVVIVTLATSRCLTELDLPNGYFTHVVLDEAAQIMECEAILPFALISNSTRVILAGDHMQLSPEVHSPLARLHGLQISLLERLYDHYPPDHPCAVLLRENYRSHPVIVQFTSKLFYQNQLQATAQVPAHPGVYPLSFFTAKGHEVQDSNSTTYYNNAEVYEVVERVTELRKTWPESWGPIDDSSIGVVSPYADQVFQLRSALRQKKLGNISVERVLNIQGKQFRVIVLSTVRTRHTCSGKEDRYFKVKEAVAKISRTHRESVAEDEEHDFGFLSNAKLLITAITRAQSLVAVVGDPIALCSIGKCRKLWEHYLQTCHQSESLHGTTYRKICVELGNLEVGVSSSLDPKAPIFIPRNLMTELPRVFPVRPLPPLVQFPLLVPMVTAPSPSPFKLSGMPGPSVRSYGSVMDNHRFQHFLENQANGMRLPHPMSYDDRKSNEELKRKVEDLVRMGRMNGAGGGGCCGPDRPPGLEAIRGSAGLTSDVTSVLGRLCSANEDHGRHVSPFPMDFRAMPFVAGGEGLERRLNLALNLNELNGAPPSRMLGGHHAFHPEHDVRDSRMARLPRPDAVSGNGFDGEMEQRSRHHVADCNAGGAAAANASQCLLSYAEAVRTSASQSMATPQSVVADFEQRVAPRTSNGLYKYF